jgi:hypothetical protein
MTLKSAMIGSSIVGSLLASTPWLSRVAAPISMWGRVAVKSIMRNGQYYDQYRHRHSYRYPSDWQSCGYNRAWYRTHANWYRSNDRE